MALFRQFLNTVDLSRYTEFLLIMCVYFHVRNVMLCTVYYCHLLEAILSLVTLFHTDLFNVNLK